MKAIFTITLAVFIWVSSMLPGLGVMELGKLPALVHHYQKHRQLNSSIGFLAFLEMHYADAAHHKQDHQEHHKLPFTDHQSISASCVFLLIDRNYSFDAKLFTIGRTNQSVYRSIVGVEIASHVWQPPRIG
jgi:hypothetical protein